MMYIILTHDVDWPRKGPGKEHILARRERFDDEILEKVLKENFNPYFGIPFIMEIEEKLGVRSTFFFRAVYDDGSKVENYRDVISDLMRGGWEVALHSNSIEKAGEEKRVVEEVSGSRIIGNRVHYLRISSYSELASLSSSGILYDSSVVFSKDRVDLRNSGYFFIERLLEFPITFMDAYLFTYSKLSEHEVVPYVIKGLESLRKNGAKIATILWHDNSIMMRGGRVYPQLLESILNLKNAYVLRGEDAYKMIEKGKIEE